MNIPEPKFNRGQIVSTRPNAYSKFVVLERVYNVDEGRWYYALFNGSQQVSSLIWEMLLEETEEKSR